MILLMPNLAKKAYWQFNSICRRLAHTSACNLDLTLSGIRPGSAVGKSLRQWEQYNQEAKTQAVNSGFTLASKEMLIRHKTSDTLFVLGSSPSINTMDDAMWHQIGRHDSIAFNYFLAHPFVPTYYHLELLNQHLGIFRSCYSQRSEAYRNIPFMVNYLHIAGELKQSDLDFVHNLSVTVPRRYAGTSASEFHSILDYAYRKIEPVDNTYLVHNRASVSLMVSFAVLLGYTRIVFAGVDLNSTGYFYCDERYACEAIRDLLELRCQDKAEAKPSEAQGFLHITADPALWPEHITIDRALEVFRDSVLKRRGIELYVTDRRSLLYPAFPVWKNK
ncbi:MAG: hypothetical protein Q8O33_12300 [Pseudomonadota bacterium]|nr:hypothetical protein [Pseudomonadota bacterium]